MTAGSRKNAQFQRNYGAEYAPYDEDVKWLLPELGRLMSTKVYHDKKVLSTFACGETKRGSKKSDY